MSVTDQELAQLREALCQTDLCIEHGTGTMDCPVPDEWDDIDTNATYMVPEGEEDDRLGPEPAPEDVGCPGCGARPTAESIAQHRLSANGYLHDDVQYECSECDRSWVHGIPIGEGGADDLWCMVCDNAWKFIHRVDVSRSGKDSVLLHVKCPNCYHFDKITRRPGRNGVALVGYPPITGATDTAQDYGYPDGEDL